IRDGHVTGVQTCALPICPCRPPRRSPRSAGPGRCGGGGPPVYNDPVLRFEGIDAVADKDRVAAILGREIGADVLLILTNVDAVRSEERRVGKEGRCRWTT